MTTEPRMNEEPGDSTSEAVILEPAMVDGATPALPDLHTFEAPGRWNRRFVIIYTVLGSIMAAAVTGLIVLVIQPGHHAAPVWSTWKPTPGTTQKVAAQIADHVAHRYRLGENEGQLVAVIPSKPEVTSGTQKIAISAVAVRQAPQSNTGIQVYTTTKTENYTFCGLGAHCSIATGTPTQERGRLVRREALEIALYTFKFAPAIDTVAAFMTPAPGSTVSQILYLRKDDLKDQLSQPLTKTLPLVTPPLPTSSDTGESATIDKLTLPHMFTYSLTALQTGGAALILDPAA